MQSDAQTTIEEIEDIEGDEIQDIAEDTNNRITEAISPIIERIETHFSIRAFFQAFSIALPLILIGYYALLFNADATIDRVEETLSKRTVAVKNLNYDPDLVGDLPTSNAADAPWAAELSIAPTSAISFKAWHDHCRRVAVIATHA